MVKLAGFTELGRHMALRTYFDLSDSYYTLRRRTTWELLHRVPFGEDPTTGQIVSILVHMTTNPPFDGPENCMELMFSVLVDTAGELTNIDDGIQTKDLIGDDQRNLALRVICLETIEILKIAKPDVVTMATIVQRLPEKALRKYDVIGAAVCAAGYRGGRGNSFEHDNIWMFEKLATVE